VTAIGAGAARVAIATAALAPRFLGDAVALRGERLVVAIDVCDGRVAVEGWTQAEPLDPLTLA
jgi:phosphoribosylformimino-5-aminoimidazole carboxamide ribotide isomerase